MDSAFGIDHGEVSKIRPPKLMPSSRLGARTARAKRVMGMGPNSTGAQGTPSGPQRAKGALHRIGEAHVSLKGIGSAAGTGAGATGRFLERHPGLTGTALVGGGGAASYKYLSGKEPKRKKS